MAGMMNRRRSRAITTIAGSRLTEVRALTVIPTGRSPSSAVTTVTPVANWPITVRKSAVETFTPASIRAAVGRHAAT